MFALFLILVVVQTSKADGGNCVAADPNKSATLEGILPLNGKKFTVTKPEGTYEIKFCSDVSPKNVNASVIRTLNASHNETVLGRHNVTDVVTDGKLMIVTFGGGDVNNSTGNCQNAKWSTVILIECNTAEESIHMMDPSNARCFALFHLYTPAICVLPKQSRWTVFFMLIFTAALCYLLIGMAYRRFVLGAKGLEQIPNYDFWKDPCGYTQDYCNRRDMRRNEPWSRTSPMADNVDEPLLHP